MLLQEKKRSRSILLTPTRLNPWGLSSFLSKNLLTRMVRNDTCLVVGIIPLRTPVTLHPNGEVTRWPHCDLMIKESPKCTGRNPSIGRRTITTPQPLTNTIRSIINRYATNLDRTNSTPTPTKTEMSKRKAVPGSQERKQRSDATSNRARLHTVKLHVVITVITPKLVVHVTNSVITPKVVSASRRNQIVVMTDLVSSDKKKGQTKTIKINIMKQ
mmetsp:Transcript_63957/g.71588  ORF Transcript_63957/g.71588 Transcript_63957/m.71588 type:complete len:215 (-) Transcript_63957:94-738(-)